MSDFTLALIFGLSGHVVTNLGFGIQKVGAGVLSLGAGILRSRAAFGKFGVWLVGLALYGLGTVLVFQALSLGDAALVSSISGVGLAALALFSGFVLREPIDRRILAGIGLIIAGTAVIGIFGLQTAREFQFNLPAMVIYLASLTLAAGLGYAWSRSTGRRRLTGFTIAFLAGVMGGSALLFHKAGAGLCAFDVSQAASLGCLARMPYFYLGFFVGTAALGVINYAYQFGTAIEIVPTFAGTFLLTPVFGGLLIYGDSITAAQWPGVAAAALGTVLLSRGEPEAK
jgi:drug/metabolite transporter (DMT)-like permease